MPVVKTKKKRERKTDRKTSAKKKDVSKERAGAPVCPLLCCQKFDGGHFEWHWRVPPEWGATRSERKEGKKESKERWGGFYIEGKKEKGSAQTFGAGIKAALPCRLPCQLMHQAYVCVSIPLIVITIMHAGHYVWLTVPGMCVLAVLWPLGPVVVVLLIFFFFRSSSRCSFCLFCTSINSEMKLFFTCVFNTKLLYSRRLLGSNGNLLFALLNLYMWYSQIKLFLSSISNTLRQSRDSVEIKLLAIRWPLSPAHRTLWALQSVLTTQQMFKWPEFTSNHVFNI